MKKLLLATAIVIAVASYNPAMAFEHKDGMNKEEFKKMSPEERKAFHEQRKAEWEKLSKEEKVKVIEERRAIRIKKMDEKWNSMSDDEKIKFVEERKERKMKKHKNKHHGDME